MSDRGFIILIFEPLGEGIHSVPGSIKHRSKKLKIYDKGYIFSALIRITLLSTLIAYLPGDPTICFRIRFVFLLRIR